MFGTHVTHSPKLNGKWTSTTQAGRGHGEQNEAQDGQGHATRRATKTILREIQSEKSGRKMVNITWDFEIAVSVGVLVYPINLTFLRFLQEKKPTGIQKN